MTARSPFKHRTPTKQDVAAAAGVAGVAAAAAAFASFVRRRGEPAAEAPAEPAAPFPTARRLDVTGEFAAVAGGRPGPAPAAVAFAGEEWVVLRAAEDGTAAVEHRGGVTELDGFGVPAAFAVEEDEDGTAVLRVGAEGRRVRLEDGGRAANTGAPGGECAADPVHGTLLTHDGEGGYTLLAADGGELAAFARPAEIPGGPIRGLAVLGGTAYVLDGGGAVTTVDIRSGKTVRRDTLRLPDGATARGLALAPPAEEGAPPVLHAVTAAADGASWGLAAATAPQRAAAGAASSAG